MTVSVPPPCARISDQRVGSVCLYSNFFHLRDISVTFYNAGAGISGRLNAATTSANGDNALALKRKVV